MHDAAFVFPLADPVYVLALIMLVVLLVPLLCERLKIPGVVGLLLAGVAIGPHGLNVVARGETMVFLSTFGLLYVMFLAGLELDLRQFRKNRAQSVLFGLLSFALPFALGTLTGRLLGYPALAAVLLGGVFASHTLLAYPVASRLGLGRARAVVATLGATLITDTLALVALAIVAGAARGALDLEFFLRLFAVLGAYLALVMWLVPRLGRWFFRSVTLQPESEVVFVLAVLCGVAGLAHLAGVEAIVGAFLAGLTLNRFLPEHSPLMSRVGVIGNGLFIPMFLISTGMIVDLDVLRTARVWEVAGAMLLVVLGSKLIASWLLALGFRYSAAEVWITFGLSITQAAATLAATLVGHRLGLFDDTLVNSIIILILATCLLGPIVVQQAGLRLAARATGLAADADAREPSPRVLVPIANPATARALVDLALLAREDVKGEPISPFSVVSEEGGATDDRVRAAEGILTAAVSHAAGAEVAASPTLRLGSDVASAICRAARETRAGLIVMGWNGERTLGSRAFGSIIDRVVAGTPVTVAVARLAVPLNTIGRIILVVPPHGGLFPRFGPVATLVTRLSRRLGVPVCVWHISRATVRRPSLASLSAGSGGSYEAIADWKGLQWLLGAAVGRDDLLVVVGSRPDGYTWEPALDKLPALLARRHDRSFLVVHPPEVAAEEPIGEERGELLVRV
ncbi:MAG: cation:proton antiporter [Candidatus Sericytochromatia bacterium]|nr:cation:proton antiporter [Candidatus Tanganyikabacteria bacterium]